MKTIIALMLMWAILVVPAVWADEEKPVQGAGEGAAAAAPKPKPATPIGRLLRELSALIARERAQPEHDQDLVKDLAELVRNYGRKAEKPVKLEDLSPADRKKIEEEVRAKIEEERAAAGGGEGGEGGSESWIEKERNRRVDRVLEGVELSEEQDEKVKGMLGDFVSEAFLAYTSGEVGLVNDLKKDLEKRLRPVVGSRKARKIINNVNRQLPGRRGGR